MVEDINDQASDFTANSVALSPQTLTRLEDINTRWKLLQLGLDEQYKKLNEVSAVSAVRIHLTNKTKFYRLPVIARITPQFEGLTLLISSSKNHNVFLLFRQ